MVKPNAIQPWKPVADSGMSRRAEYANTRLEALGAKTKKARRSKPSKPLEESPISVVEFKTGSTRTLDSLLTLDTRLRRFSDDEYERDDSCSSTSSDEEEEEEPSRSELFRDGYASEESSSLLWGDNEAPPMLHTLLWTEAEEDNADDESLVFDTVFSTNEGWEDPPAAKSSSSKLIEQLPSRSALERFSSSQEFSLKDVGFGDVVRNEQFVAKTAQESRRREWSCRTMLEDKDEQHPPLDYSEPRHRQQRRYSFGTLADANIREAQVAFKRQMNERKERRAARKRATSEHHRTIGPGTEMLPTPTKNSDIRRATSTGTLTHRNLVARDKTSPILLKEKLRAELNIDSKKRKKKGKKKTKKITDPEKLKKRQELRRKQERLLECAAFTFRRIKMDGSVIETTVRAKVRDETLGKLMDRNLKKDALARIVYGSRRVQRSMKFVLPQLHHISYSRKHLEKMKASDILHLTSKRPVLIDVEGYADELAPTFECSSGKGTHCSGTNTRTTVDSDDGCGPL